MMWDQPRYFEKWFYFHFPLSHVYPINSDFKRTPGLLYSKVGYNMVLDIKLIIVRPQLAYMDTDLGPNKSVIKRMMFIFLLYIDPTHVQIKIETEIL